MMCLFGRTFLLGLIGIFSLGAGMEVSAEPVSSADVVISRQEVPPPLLPRWRAGGTPYDSRQSLYPYAIAVPRPKDVPATGLIESPPEYSPTHGVVFYYVSSQWPTVVRDLVVALTSDPQYDEIAYVVVSSTSQRSSATSLFTSGGADMSKVEFIIQPANALWMRDYGPHFIWQGGALAIVDSHYYPDRSLDNFIPTLLGDDHLEMPTYDMGLYYSGGNFQPGPDRSGFATSLVNLDNPSSQGFDSALIAELFAQYQGIDTLHVMSQLPFSVDGTGHIDMWMYIVDEDTVIISEFKPGSNATAIAITNNAVTYMEGLGFEVFRTPAWNAYNNSYWTHFTYTNAFRVNDRIFVISFGEGSSSYLDEDADALAAWEAAAGPDVELVVIDAYDIIWASGAFHCIVMQVPRYTAEVPAVQVTSPVGGELLVSGTNHAITWVASDTDNAVIPQIDLYYSTDGGDNYTHIVTTSDDGSYNWMVPDVSSDEALVKVVATSSDTDQAESVSAGVFAIAAAQQTVYDFTSGAGVNRFGWGYQTSNWNTYVEGRHDPVASEVDTLVGTAYTRLAHSDATGGDSDSDRYISPDPSNGYESTHVFEFTIAEDPADIDDIAIRWEGYGDWCTQIELYVWDDVEGTWSDGHGLFGQNRFMDNWAGNRDGYLEGHIRSDFGRYIDDADMLTLLLYSERDNSGYYVDYTPSFHDYVSVTVSDAGSIPEPLLPEDSLGQTCTDDGHCANQARCVSGICYAPKHRYLSVAANPDQIENTARRIRTADGTVVGWVGAPFEEVGLTLADVVPAPVYADLGFVGSWPDLVHVSGCPIATGEVYRVDAIRVGKNIADDGNYSEAIELHTPDVWGDVVSTCSLTACLPPQGRVDIDDILAEIAAFQSQDKAPMIWFDLAPVSDNGVPDRQVNIDDILAAIAGFQSVPYPGNGPTGCS